MESCALDDSKRGDRQICKHVWFLVQGQLRWQDRLRRFTVCESFDGFDDDAKFSLVLQNDCQFEHALDGSLVEFGVDDDSEWRHR